MKLNIAICDDDHSMVMQIQKILLEYQFVFRHDFHIDCFNSAEDFLSVFHIGKYHIIMLDVEMMGMDGIQTAAKIRSLQDKNVTIIFISHYPQYMSQAFDVKAFHYIQKNPDTRIFSEKLNHVLNNAIDEMTSFSSSIQIPGPDHLVHVFRIPDILYIITPPKEKGNLLICYAGIMYKGSERILNIYQAVKEYGFIYINRWTIVNLRHIRSFNKKQLEMDNGVFLELSRKYKDELEKRFINIIFR